jgi:hypothetical protein
MSRLVASSTSKSPAVVKILIDLDEYLRLKSLKTKYDEAEEKLKQCLEKHEQEDKHVDKFASDIEEIPQPQTQVGSGHNLPLTDDSIEKISKIVFQRITDSYDLTPKITGKTTSQIGQGAQLITQINQPTTNKDLIQPVATHANIPDNTFVEPLVIKENDESNAILQQKLLKSIPEKLKSQATELLSELSQRPSQLTFNSDGVLFVNQIGIPETNFFQLFPMLFKKNQQKKLAGFPELVTQIATMGLGHLISKSLTRGLLRKYKILEQDTLFNQVLTLKNWYYLGNP